MRDGRTLGRWLISLAALGMPWSAAADDIPCEGKNHYILREPCIQEMRLAWSTAATPLLHHVDGHAATLLADGRALVLGGWGGIYDARTQTWAEVTGGAELYDPVRDTWSHAGAMAEPRGWGVQAVRLFDGRVLVLGGESLNTLKGTAEIFDPQSSSFSPAASLLIPRVAFTATLLPDGRVLVAGGVDKGDETVRSAEIYDPASGRWTLTGGLFEPRWGHTATALANGKVLVVGGVIDDWVHEPAVLAEVFDPATGKWTQVGESVRAWLHTATLLPDGRVVVAGGTRHLCPRTGGWCSEDSSDAAYVFDPASSTWSAPVRMMGPRHGHLALALGRRGSVLLVGGRVGVAPVPNYQVAPVQRLERFGFGPNRWQGVVSTNPPPADLDQFYSATRLADGSILLVGGNGQGGRAALLR